MARTFSTAFAAPYGAVELRNSYQRHWWMAFLIAVAIHAGVIAGYFAFQFTPYEQPRRNIFVQRPPGGLPPPPLITDFPRFIPEGAPKVNQGEKGTPVPVPDIELTTEKEFATQDQMSLPSGSDADGSTATDGAGTENVPVIVIPEPEDEPVELRLVEHEPQIVKLEKPVYPELALRAQLEGKVWVKILVDKEGKPREVKILKSTNEIFDDAAMDAAKKFVFTPAYMTHGPVSVWVSLPFVFRLVPH